MESKKENFKKVWIYQDKAFNSLGVHYEPKEWEILIDLTEWQLGELQKLWISELSRFIQKSIVDNVLNH